MAMDARMQDQELGCTAAICGVFDGAPYQLFVMKNDGYDMKLMSTYGTLHVPPDAKVHMRKIGNEIKTFQYTEPFHNHYKYKHAVDDHNNNNRHSDLSMEETWVRHPGSTVSFLSYSHSRKSICFWCTVTSFGNPEKKLSLLHIFVPRSDTLSNLEEWIGVGRYFFIGTLHSGE
jgi:hypothetical protein